MTKNHDRKWASQLHDILWAVHDGKNRGRSEGEENFGEFLVTVGGRGPSDCTAGYALLNPSDRVIPSLLLLIEADRCCLWDDQ